MKKFFILSFAAFALASCGGETTPSGADHADTSKTPVINATDWLGKEPMDSMAFDGPKNFGPVSVTEDGAIAVVDLPKTLGTQDSMKVKVKGIISACCQNKGCWMTMPLADGSEMRVKFKDYGFFVPQNSGGKEVVVDGWAYRTMISVDEQRHYAMDGGATEAEAAKITEPKEEISFIADGALIRPHHFSSH